MSRISPQNLRLGPVVQNIVSLTSLLRGQLSVLQLYTQIHLHFCRKQKSIGVFEILSFKF